MTVQLYEGCWGVTLGREKRGPIITVRPEQAVGEVSYIFFRVTGLRTYWTKSGVAKFASDSRDDIIAVFATEAEADAYLAGETASELPDELTLFSDDQGNFSSWLSQSHKNFTTSKWRKVSSTGTPPPAPKPVTWPDRRWEAMLVLAGGLASAIAEVKKRPGETQAQADARWCREHASALLLAAADKVEGRG